MEEYRLRQRQSLPLGMKIKMSQRRIRDWYNHWNGEVYVSFSGGKDSTVLLHLAHSVYSDIPAVFCDTGLEYPEIRDFVKDTPNVTWIKPKTPFNRVIELYGYPVISKEVSQKIFEIRTTHSEKLRNKRLHGDDKNHGKLSAKWQYLVDAPFPIGSKCCDALKKRPFKDYEKQTGRKPILGLTAEESRLRTMTYLKNEGCNAFNNPRPTSNPMSFWADTDIWNYIRIHNLPISEIYYKGYHRTGCMFCLFGIHQDNTPNRFQRMKTTHPAQYRYCMNQLGIKDILSFLKIPFD